MLPVSDFQNSQYWDEIWSVRGILKLMILKISGFPALSTPLACPPWSADLSRSHTPSFCAMMTLEVLNVMLMRLSFQAISEVELSPCLHSLSQHNASPHISQVTSPDVLKTENKWFGKMNNWRTWYSLAKTLQAHRLWVVIRGYHGWEVNQDLLPS